MNIISYNVNGIRAALTKGLKEWLSGVPCDVFCIQETKAQPDQVEQDLFADLGLIHNYWHSAEKKGYSGVATYSRHLPDLVELGMGSNQYDQEGRVLRTDWGDFTLLNCYFPSGTTGDIRQDFKMKFLDDFFEFAMALKAKRPNMLILGDYNIAHTEMDIHDPKGNKNSSGFLPEEREWMSKWLQSGFHDAFRTLHPEKVEYSWWSYRAGARAKNKGWRIDYQSVSDPLAEKIKSAGHYNDAVHSDHCPVFLSIDL